MMKKTIKKLLAALLAVAMVCAMAIPAFAYNPGETEENLNGTHGYSAFQIFKGVISKDNPTLSGVDWGQNITEPDIFLANLKNDPTIGEKFETAATAQEVLAVISQWSNSDDNSIALRALYAAISTRMQTQNRNPSLQITPVASTFQSQVII